MSGELERVSLKGRGLFPPSQPKGTMWQLEARAAGEAVWRVVSTEKADPVVKVGGLAPGNKYTFRSREGVGPATLRAGERDGRRPLPRKHATACLLRSSLVINACIPLLLENSPFTSAAGARSLGDRRRLRQLLDIRAVSIRTPASLTKSQRGRSNYGDPAGSADGVCWSCSGIADNE